MFHVPLQRICAAVDIRNGEENGNHAKFMDPGLDGVLGYFQGHVVIMDGK